MYQKIGESISVSGMYIPGKFQPKQFQWRRRSFLISQVCAVHDFKDGSVKKRKFAVVAHHTVYVLEFNRDLETWILDQVWVEEGQ